MNFLVGYEADFHYASQSGLMVIPESLHTAVLGKDIELGEVAGKHSSAYVRLDAENFMVLSRDQDLIARLTEALLADPWGTLHGCNPLDRLYEQQLEDYDLNDDLRAQLDAMTTDMERLEHLLTLERA